MLLAAHRQSGVARVDAINPYDYAKGRGAARANLVTWLIFTSARIPLLGETVMRFRNPLIERKIMEGGVAEPNALPESFLREFHAVGCRRGH